MAIALAILTLASLAQNQQLMGADEVLRRLKVMQAAQTASRQAEPPEMDLPASYRKQMDLSKRMKQFYSEMPHLEPVAAGRRWLGLLDDAIVTGADIDQVVSIMPPPQSWPVIQGGLEARMAKKTTVRGAAFRLFGSLLGEDRQAQVNALRSSWAIASKAPAVNRSSALESLDRIGSSLAVHHGNLALLKETLLRAASDPNRTLYIEDSMLDLLGAEKEAFLGELLRKARGSLSYSSYYSAAPNGKLIYKLALQSAAEHQSPQWGLAERMDNIELYEAIAKKFNPFKPWPESSKKKVNGVYDRFNDDRRGLLARTYYLLSLAKAGNLEKALKGAGDGATLVLDYSFQREHQPDPNVNEFLRRVLIAHPRSASWGHYEASALALGRHQELLDATEKALKYPKLTDKDRKLILHSRESGLLALDRVDEALATMRKRMAIDVKQSNSMSSNEAIYRIEGLAKLLDRKDLAKEVEGYHKKGKYAGHRSSAEEKDLAKREAEIAKPDGGFSSYSFGNEIGTQLISIYSAANRPVDVIKIAEAEGIWSEEDIREVENKGDYGMRYESTVPASVAIGQALIKVGRKDEAYPIAKDFVSRNIGNDVAYEFFVSCDSKEIIADLDALVLLNAYEERPLIWKAKVLLGQGKIDEAEQAIKAAIAIDPSDGEQPHGRRMFAYTVYADILEKKGDAIQASVLRGAVRAIRMAEKADDFLEAGLINRAIKMYDEALALFADAYCIQSRIAVNLAQAGRMPEAVSHYRRAYELMADSFGYVETHCLGCEDAFTGEIQQKIAEEVFTKIAEERPTKPQIHYLLGFLREAQGRGQDAVKHYKRAVELDGRYLNAWRRLGEVGKQNLSAEELESIKSKVAQLEPRVEARSSYASMVMLTFADAYRKGEQSLTTTKAPLFKLKRKPAASYDIYGDYESSSRWGYMGGEPTTPGGALMQTALYRGFNTLLSQR